MNMHDLPPSPALTTLGSKTQSLLRTLAGDALDYALLDFPAHGNIGDSAIWLGEINLLTAMHGRWPRHVSMHRYPPAQPGQVMGDDCVLYMHGGGNFGDIWPAYQRYRIAVTEANHHRRIVQLPQSIHFSDPALIEPTRRAIGAHPDYHLVVRDAESAEFAQAHFDCSVHMAPDSAFGIDTMSFPRHSAPEGMVTVLRTDKEQRGDATGAEVHFPAGTVLDWPVEGRGTRLTQKSLLGAALALPPTLTGRLPGHGYTALARWRVARGFSFLDRGQVIVTDRLHGHIMGSLLGKPTVVVDNFYGKIRRFVGAWGALSPVYLAADYAQAQEIADALLRNETLTPDAGPGSA